MPKIDFLPKEISSIKSHLVTEHDRLTKELAHVELLMEKFNVGKQAKSGRQGKLSETGLTAKGLPPKKRGPKSVWGAFILKRLRARNRPMSYDELIDDAMSIHKIPESRKQAASASILNSAFRLRTVHGKIVTVGRPGKKSKLVVLTKWLDSSGTLKPPYAKQFKELMGGKAKAVNMDGIPVSPYQEED